MPSCSAMSISSTSKPFSTKGINSASATSQRWQPRVPKSWHSGVMCAPLCQRGAQFNTGRRSARVACLGGEQRLQAIQQAAVETVGLVQTRLVETLVEREAALEQILEQATRIPGQLTGTA